MVYERNDRPYGNQGDRGSGGYGADRERGFDQSHGRDRETGRGDYGRNDYGRDGSGRGSQDPRAAQRRDYGGDPRGYDQDRGFLERAGDEVRSWFGDEDAERRRQFDDRSDQRDEQRSYGDRGYGQRDRGYASADQGRGRAPAGAGDYGRGAASSGGGAANRDNRDGGGHHDISYSSWRDRQMESFDRDYDEFRREHQSRFDSEFKTWRQGRQGQRDLLGQVQEHFEVVGSDGEHVGTVDHVKNDQIELTKSDKDAGGRHHLIPSSWLQAVEGNKVMLSKTADQAKQHWRDEARDAGGDTNPNRSFSGSY